MPTFGATLDGFVRADDLDVTRTISGVPTGQTLTDAWLRVNAANGTTLVFEKHITGTLVAGQGQIQDAGASGVGVVRFELVGGTTGDTTLLTPELAHVYDIQVKTSAGKIYTPENGTMKCHEQIVLQV